MNIAILGLGTVGYGVYDLASKIKEIKVKYILVKKGDKLENNLYTDDIDTIINDKDVDLVVETIGGVTASYDYIVKALKGGKHVVTANKAVVAANYEEFVNLAKVNNVKLSFEASVGGGIPIIKNLLRSLRFENIDEFHGILNGTSNFILDNMTRFNKDFDEVLAEAKALGYAEADPSSDIDGIDTANKIRIVTNLINKDATSDDFLIEGIRKIKLADIKYYETLGCSVRLIAKLINLGNEYNMYVIPKLFSKNDLESNILLNNNLCSYTTKSLGEVKLVGQGAGRYPTANAIIEDILDIKNAEANFNLEVLKEKTFNPNLTKASYLVRTSEKLNPSSYQVNNDYYTKYEDLTISKLKEILSNLSDYFVVEM